MAYVKMVLQTYCPEHPQMEELLKGNYGTFIENIIKDRASANVPPFSYQVKLQAEKEFRRAIEIRPDMRTAHYMLGKLHYENGDFRQALESYQMALNIDADYPEAILNLGATYQRLGDNSAAVQAYKRALDLRPGWLLALENLANAIYGTGEFEHAAALYEKLLRLQPAHLRRDLFERRIIEFRSMSDRAVQALDD